MTTVNYYVSEQLRDEQRRQQQRYVDEQRRQVEQQRQQQQQLYLEQQQIEKRKRQALSRGSGQLTFIAGDWKCRLRREMRCSMLGLEEGKPTKFATCAWFRSQIPYLGYRIVVFVYAVVSLSLHVSDKLSLKIDDPTGSLTEDEKNVQLLRIVLTWLSSLPLWILVMFTIYHTMMLVFTSFEFCDDCLCNDDMNWYHKISWIFQNCVLNGSLVCLLAAVIYMGAVASGNEDVQLATLPFYSDDVKIYVILPLAMLLDVMLTDTRVRLLHVIHPLLFHSVFHVCHVFVWAGGLRQPWHPALFDYADAPARVTTSVAVHVMLACPLLHAMAYLLDQLRVQLLVACVARHRERLSDVIADIERYTVTSSPSRSASRRAGSGRGDVIRAQPTAGFARFT